MRGRCPLTKKGMRETSLRCLKDMFNFASEHDLKETCCEILEAIKIADKSDSFLSNSFKGKKLKHLEDEIFDKLEINEMTWYKAKKTISKSKEHSIKEMDKVAKESAKMVKAIFR